MAVTKILARRGGLSDAIKYVVNGDKTEEQLLVATRLCSKETAYQEMMAVKRRYNKLGKVQNYHIIQAFRPREATPETALEIASAFVDEHLPGYQAVIGVHVDRHHIHAHIVEVPAEDSSEEAVEETETVELTRLLITINRKTAEQMAEEYGFTQEQLGYVTELLSDEYTDFWAMLSVPGVGSDDIVAVALSQVGNGGETYWSWYGFTSRVSWCACFVSWCADQCGYIEAGIFPKFSYCDTGVDWFKAQGLWQDRYYIPAPGDIIFFDWNGDGTSDHVAIVESCDGATVYTVEGNANDLVKRLSYAVGSSSIMGYGTLQVS